MKYWNELYWRRRFEGGVAEFESAGWPRDEAERWTLAEMMPSWMRSHPELGNLDYRKAADVLGWICGSALPELQRLRCKNNQ